MGIVGDRISDAGRRAAVAAALVLAAPLSAIDALLRRHVADGLEQTAFAELVADSVVDVVLELVDLIDASYFRFAKSVCITTSIRTISPTL